MYLLLCHRIYSHYFILLSNHYCNKTQKTVEHQYIIIFLFKKIIKPFICSNAPNLFLDKSERLKPLINKCFRFLPCKVFSSKMSIAGSLLINGSLQIQFPISKGKHIVTCNLMHTYQGVKRFLNK